MSYSNWLSRQKRRRILWAIALAAIWGLWWRGLYHRDYLNVQISVVTLQMRNWQHRMAIDLVSCTESSPLYDGESIIGSKGMTWLELQEFWHMLRPFYWPAVRMYPADSYGKGTYHFLGFGYGPMDPQLGLIAALIIPDYFPWLIAATGLVRCQLKINLCKSRHRDGKCLACGYDLRGSPTRCPECGWDTKQGIRF